MLWLSLLIVVNCFTSWPTSSCFVPLPPAIRRLASCR
jgi:hypothetical protein